MKMNFTETMFAMPFKDLNWEQVGAAKWDQGGAVDSHFLKHIEDFQHNRFLNLGITYFFAIARVNTFNWSWKIISPLLFFAMFTY